MPEPGAVIADRWLLGEELGGGGFATVFRGSRVSDGLLGAIKVILPHQTGSTRETAVRFAREVEALARIDEPHTVRLLDHGKTPSGLLFLVCELVEGKDLSTVIAERGPIEPSIVRHVMTQLLYALRAAHRAGLLHRDIKPSNIRVQADGADPWRVKLLDFGIARDERLERGGKLTATGVLIGTPRYMSPEQLRALPLGPASDLYSVGLVAAEMLTGHSAARDGSVQAQLSRVLTADAIALPGNVDHVLRRTLSALLRPQASERPQSADAVLRMLSGGHDMRSPSPAHERGPTGRERPWRILAPILGLCVLLAVLTGYVIGDPKSEPTVRARPAQAVVQAPRADIGAIASTTDFARPEDTQELDGPDAAFRDPKPLREGALEKIGLELPEHLFEVYYWLPIGFDYERQYPVLIVFPDQFDTPVRLLEHSDLWEVADSEQFLLILISQPFDFNWSRSDFHMIEASMERVERKGIKLERRNIFGLGIGRGGRMAEHMGCRVDNVRGVVTTAYRSTSLSYCRRKRPHLHIAEMHSPQVPTAGGRSCTAIANTSPVLPLADHIADWRKLHGCGGERVEHGDSRCYTWKCETPFVVCELDGGQYWVAPREKYIDLDCQVPPTSDPIEPVLAKFLATHRQGGKGE